MRHVLSWIREKDEALFASFFAPHAGVKLDNARQERLDLEAMDALLLTGGADISAAYLRRICS